MSARALALSAALAITVGGLAFAWKTPRGGDASPAPTATCTFSSAPIQARNITFELNGSAMLPARSMAMQPPRPW